MFSERYFFELAVYRVSEEQFNQKYDENLKHNKLNLPKFHFNNKEVSETYQYFEQRFWETYGGPWQYNQVIGWLRLCILGTQIRGEFWKMRGKRMTRKSCNQIIPVGKVFELITTPDETSEHICYKLKEELKQLQKAWSKKKHTLDLRCFDTIKSYVDWNKLIYN